MKSMLIASALLLVAGSVAAATQKPATAATTTAATDTTATAQPATATVPDSPLVAAAKKASHGTPNGKKRIVITDESVKNSTGHITTTRVQPSINVAEPAKGAEQVLYETKQKEKERAAERAKLAKKAAEEKQKTMARASAAAEENGGLEEDPAQTEHKLEQQSSNPRPTATSAQPSPSKQHDAKHR